LGILAGIRHCTGQRGLGTPGVWADADREDGGRSRDGLEAAWRVKKKVGRRRKDEPSQFGEHADLLWKDCSQWPRMLLRRNVRKIFVAENAAITLSANECLGSGEADDRQPAVAVTRGDKVAQAA
jgi:hypothetical protein